MQKKLIDYQKTGYFSDIVLDYLAGAGELKDFYDLPFEPEAFQKAIERRKFTAEKRKLLVSTIREQYERGGISLSGSSRLLSSIELLAQENTFTVTTGHQLCLFTGPLYFIYKLFTTINLCEALKKKYPVYNFVPVYWMASEDHDFAEVNHFSLFGKKLEWEIEAGGAVGRLDTASLKKVLEEFRQIAGDRETAQELIGLFEECYLNSKHLADATRKLVHRLYEPYGLLCLDADEASLKAEMKEVFSSELTSRPAYQKVKETTARLEKKYKLPVHPREINLFYLQPGSRERIIEADNGEDFVLADSKKSFSRKELLAELETNPERFSPNVVLRPLYQEVILPNLAYVGGGSEVAYWMQLRSLFSHFEVDFPVLVLRNSALWIDRTSLKKLKKNEITDLSKLFLPAKELIKVYATRTSGVDLNFNEEEKQLEEVFEKLKARATAVDQSLVPFVKAEHQKVENMLKELRGRLIRAEKKNNETGVSQLKSVKEKLFPNDTLQERVDNFSTLYLQYGQEFFSILKETLDPFNGQFIVYSEEEL